MPAESVGEQQVCLISLTSDEALVLFELLSRTLDSEKAAGLRTLVEDDSEIWALNAVLIELERSVSVLFAADYKTHLSAARSRVATINGGAWPWFQTE